MNPQDYPLAFGNALVGEEFRSDFVVGKIQKCYWIGNNVDKLLAVPGKKSNLDQNIIRRYIERKNGQN